MARSQRWADRLRSAMDQARMNQTQVANALGTNQSSVQNWLNGIVPNSTATGRRLAEVLGQDPDEWERIMEVAQVEDPLRRRHPKLSEEATNRVLDLYERELREATTS